LRCCGTEITPGSLFPGLKAGACACTVVNAVARNLGLEVAKRAAVEDTIARLRAAVRRAG